jgi:beta-ketodecanoyl-[acyl-carrier-protein] synthase
VFKEVCPAVAEQISAQLADAIAMPPDSLKRLWLHQANLNMNQLIARRVLGRDPSTGRGPGNPRSLRQYQLRRLGDRLSPPPRRP